LSLSQDVGTQVFDMFSLKNIFCTIHGTHKQYSLLDAIFHYIFDFGAQGNHLYVSPQTPLHVGRWCVLLTFVRMFSWGSKIQDIDK
jgi:hypothetical protein